MYILQNSESIPVVVEPGEKPRAVPVLIRSPSVSVRPQHLWFVLGNELVKLRERFSVGKGGGSEEVGGILLKERVEPLKQRMIQPQTNTTVGTHGTRHFIHQVSLWSHIYSVPVPGAF